MKATMMTLRGNADGFIARMGNYQRIEKIPETRSIECPGDGRHHLLRSKEKIFCESCGVWWHDHE